MCSCTMLYDVGRENSPFARDDDRVQQHCFTHTTHARKARINDDIFTLKNTNTETNNLNNNNLIEADTFMTSSERVFFNRFLQ